MPSPSSPSALDKLGHHLVRGVAIGAHGAGEVGGSSDDVACGAAVDLAHAGVAGIVGQHHQIAGKAGRMCARKSHQHSIVTRNGDDLHFRNDR
mgnify:CR=1 FL=1